MSLLTTKVKLILFLLIVSAAIFAIYWIFIRGRQGIWGRHRSVFTIPTERIQKKVLANGMHVLVFQNRSLPKVLVQIAYDVGSYVEDSGERGLAHLVEHMIYKGTDKLSESDIDTIARKYGASFNAFTSLDITSYHFETNKNNWKPFLPILADCMQNARFDAQHLASEVKAVVQELKMGKDNYWRTMMLKASELIFPPYHPYHTPTIGFQEDLLHLDAENLKKFYKKYYRPDRATLFIIGDVDLDDAVASAEEHFQHIQADASSVVKNFPVVVPELVTHHTRYYEDVKGEHLGFYWVIPGQKSGCDMAASALETILGGGQSGRLYRLLVDEKKVASAVHVTASRFMEAGVFLILIEPMTGKNEQCMQLVKQELEHIIKHGIKSNELEWFAKRKSNSFFLKMQDFDEFAYSWIKSYFATRDELDLFKRINQAYEIDGAQVQEYAKKYLDPFLMSRIEVLPLPESKKQLKESMKQMSDELDQKILSKNIRTTPVELPKSALSYASPAALSFQFPKPESVFKLANGMNIILAPNKNIPMVTINCQFKDALFLGEALDGVDVEMMMNMLMEGSKGYTKKDNVDFFEQQGAGYAFDTQGGRLICLKDDFNQLAKRFVHVLVQPTFPREAIEKLKKIEIDNYQRAKDSPKSMALRLLKNAIYKGHPFSWTYDEAITKVKSLHAGALKKLHDEYVSPANMVISVVGDFDSKQMSQELENLFGGLPAGKEKKIFFDQRIGSSCTNIDHPMLRDQVVLLLGQQSTVNIYDPDLIPLRLLTTVCFRSLGSRIYRLREQTGLFYSAFGVFATNATKEPGFDYVGMIVSPENVVSAEKQARELLERLAHDGVTIEEVDAARTMYLKDLIDLISDNSSIARMLCTIDSLNLGFDYYDKVLEQVQTMKLDHINTVLKKHCTPKHMMRVRVGPLSNVRDVA